MRLRGCRVRERHQVNCDMAYDAFLVKYLPYRGANRLHIHVGQRLLGEKTATIYVLTRLELVETTR